MAATTPLIPKSSYNNVKISFITPNVDKNIYVANNASYPYSGNAYIQFDGTHQSIHVDLLEEYTASNGISVDQVLLRDGYVRMRNDSYLKAHNALGTNELNILKINASNKLEFDSTLDLNWQTYTPTITPGGSMTYTGTSIKWGNSNTGWLYYQVGDLVLLKGYVSGTTGGTASSYFDVTLPAAAADSNQYFDVLTYENGSSASAGYAYLTSTTNLRVFKAGGGAWTLAANTGFILTGAWYRVA